MNWRGLLSPLPVLRSSSYEGHAGVPILNLPVSASSRWRLVVRKAPVTVIDY